LGLKEDQEFALAACKRLVGGLPARLMKKGSAIASRLEQAQLSSLKELEAIYELVGEIGAYVAPSTLCRKGCSSCCHFAVTISEVEVQYIETHTRYRRLKQVLPTDDYHGQACPFLKKQLVQHLLSKAFRLPSAPLAGTEP